MMRNLLSNNLFNYILCFISVRSGIENSKFSKLTGLHDYISNSFSTSIDWRNLFKYSPGLFSKTRTPLISGFVLSTCLYSNKGETIALCNSKEKGRLPINASKESHFQGFTRLELKETSPSLFNFFYTEDFEERDDYLLNEVGPLIKAKAFDELLQMGEEAVKKVKNQKITIIIGEGRSGKSTLVTWLSGANVVRKLKETTKEYVYEKDPEQKAGAPSRISHSSSGTSVPVVVEVSKGQILVDMPGMQDTRSEMITVANSMLLQNIINASGSVSFVLTVGVPSLKSISGRQWKKDLNIFMNSLEISKEDVNSFQLGAEGKRNSPVMILVNNTRSEDLVEMDLSEFKKRAAVLLDESTKDEKLKTGHLVYVYSPSKSSRADVLMQISSLKKESHEVKVVPNNDQQAMCLNDLSKLTKAIETAIGFLKKESSLSELKRYIRVELVPCFRYCDAICAFAEGDTLAKYERVKQTFEEELLSVLKDKLIEAIKNKNLKEVEEVAAIINLVTEKVDTTQHFVREVVNLLTKDVLYKTSPNVAGILTTGSTALVATNVGIATLKGMTIATAAFNPVVGGIVTLAFAASAVTATVATGAFWNYQRFDQKIIDKIRSVGKDKIPLYKPLFYNEGKLSRLYPSYKKILENISDQAIKHLEIRDRERSRLNSLLLEINEILEKGEYYELRNSNKYFVREEKNLFQKTTNEFLSAIAESNSLADKKEKEEDYKTSYSDNFKTIEELASMTKDEFLALIDSDQDELMSKIKSLKIILSRLHSVHKKYLEKSKISKWAELEESQMDRTQESWIEMGLNKGKNILDSLTPQFIKARPMTNEAKG